MDKANLFNEFKPTSKDEWKSKVIADLKGKDFEQLIWQTEGLDILPFYTKEDLLEVPTGSIDSFLYPNTTHDVPNEGYAWQNLEKVLVHDSQQANKKALEALNHGADGIIFEIPEGIPEFNLLLKDIVLQSCAIYFTGTDKVILPFQSYIESQCLSEKQLNGGFLCSPSSIQSDLILKESPRFKRLYINNALPPSEENSVQQLVATLQQAVAGMDVFTDKSIDPVIILNNLIVSFEIGSSYFKEIAKLRACRILIAGVAAAYQVKGYNIASLHIHCEISGTSSLQADTYNNMLHNTTGTMAAILGGCNSLFVHPHDEEISKNSNFSNRIARNISLILKEEAYFDKVSDPAAGSYYIENLTNLFVEKAWEQFLALV